MKSEMIQDLEQQKIILKEINLTLRRQNHEIQNKNASNAKLIERQPLSQQQTEYKIKQSQTMFDSRRKYTSVTYVIALVGLTLLTSSLYYQNHNIVNITPNQFTNNTPDSVIQNLQGDTVKTWHAWHLATGQVLHVDIMNEKILSPDQIFAIKDSILSTQTVTLDDSLVKEGPAGVTSVYYKGWQGALDAVSKTATQFQVPDKFEISDSPSGTGEILIQLASDENPDGLSGFTKSISVGNQILKTTITIYNANSLSPVQLSAIMRHEFGHAMGLAHSTDPQDLMHATIQTSYPFISSCDVDAITALYNDTQSSQVVCGKQ